MLALMIEKLAGCEPLQRKILLYCFETPTSTAIKSVIKDRIKGEEDQNNATLWRYYNEKFNGDYHTSSGARYTIVYAELKIAKSLHNDHSLIRNLERLKKKYVSNNYYLLSARESVHGTPSCICIRTYMVSLFMRGIQLRDHETLWAKFSYDEIRNRQRNNMSHLLCPTVKNDLTMAIKEMNEYKRIYSSHISFW